MKRKNFIILLLLMSVVSPSNLKSQKVEPEQLGHNTFQIMKRLDVINKEEFISGFLKLVELRAYPYNLSDTLSAIQRTKIELLKKTEWEKNLSNTYGILIENYNDANVSWDTLEYLDFVYEMEGFGGIDFYDGVLVFRIGQNIFDLEIKTIKTEKGYKLVELEL